MFTKANRLKLRFNSPAGQISVEDLWDLPLISKTSKPNLDDIAKDLFQQLRVTAVASFVVKENKENETLQLKFDIVKHIIDTRLAENDIALQAGIRKEKKQQLLAIIAQKENEELAGSSKEELRKMMESY